jgi:hypothetical protein
MKWKSPSNANPKVPTSGISGPIAPASKPTTSTDGVVVTPLTAQSEADLAQLQKKGS